MKRFCLILSLFTLLTLTVGVRQGFAQNQSNKLGINVGALLDKGFDTTLSYEHETKYHNAWEYFLNGYLQYAKCEDCGHICDKSFWNNYNTYSFGVAYKPCIARTRNSHANLRIGGSVGYDTDDYIITGLHVGYEHDYSLKNGYSLYWQMKCDGMICARDFLRAGITLGVKLPI